MRKKGNLKFLALSSLCFFVTSCFFSLPSYSSINSSTVSSSSEDRSQDIGVLVTDFLFDISSSVISVGKTCQISNLKVYPKNATNPEISFSIKDPTIASISGNTITGLKEGATKVVGITTDGTEITKEVPLSVIEASANPDQIESLNLTLDETTCYLGEQVSASVSVSPNTADLTAYHLEASPSGYVTIGGHTITPIQVGTVQITAYADDGSGVVSNSVSLNILNVKPTSIEVDVSKNTISVGESVNLNASTLPEGSEGSLSYQTESGTESVISVSAEGVVKGIGAGTDSVIITVSDFPEITKKVSFTVEAKGKLVSSITLSLPESSIFVGEKINASLSFLPLDAENTDFHLIATPSDLVSIFAKKITALKEGTVKIKAQAEDEGGVYSNEVSLQIKKVVTTGISVNPSTTNLYPGQVINLNAQIEPENAPDKEISYEVISGLNTVLKVSSSGDVTALGVGTGSVKTYVTNHPEFSVTTSFKVSEIEPTSITVTPNPVNIDLEQSVQLEVSVLPSNSFSSEVTFSVESGFEDYISVYSNGLVFGIEPGVGYVRVAHKVRTSVYTIVQVNVSNKVDPTNPYGSDIFSGV